MPKIKMCDSDNKSIKDGCEEFLLMCKVRNYSKYTIKYYQNVIHNFELFYPLDSGIEEVTELIVNKYLLFLNNKGIAGKTVKTYIGGIRTVFYFFMEKEWIEKFIIKMPKFEKPIKNVYMKEELNKQLHSKLTYDDAENLFNLIIDHGEHCSEKYFKEGMISGIRLFKELLYT